MKVRILPATGGMLRWDFRWSFRWMGWDEIGRGEVTGKADLLYDAAVGGPAGEFGAV